MTQLGVVERDRALLGAVSERYARFYAPLAVVLMALVFFPPFEDVQQGSIGEVTVTYGSLFDMARRHNGDPAVFGLIIIAALVVCLAVAVLRPPRHRHLPLVIAGLSGLAALMLLAKPGTGSPAPDLSSAGRAGVLLLFGTVACAVAHMVHLRVERGRTR
jgi:hypothetical protein